MKNPGQWATGGNKSRVGPVPQHKRMAVTGEPNPGNGEGPKVEVPGLTRGTSTGRVKVR